MIGTWELIVIILVVLVLFGANKIPEFVKSLTQSMNEFKKAASDIKDDNIKNP